MSRHHAPDRAGTLVLAAGGCLSMLGVAVAALLAVGIAAATLGPQLGTTVGCVSAVSLQLGAVGLARLRPLSPGGIMVTTWCWSAGIPLFTVCAPIGLALQVIPERETATWAGFGTGTGLLVIGWLALRLLSARHHKPAATSSGETASPSTPQKREAHS